MWTASEALPVRANSDTLAQHSARLPEQGAFFVRQSDKFIDVRVCCRVISAAGYGSTMRATSANINVAAWPISRASLSAWSASASAASG